MLSIHGGIGIIQKVNLDGTCSVKFFENEGIIIEDLQYMTRNNHNKKEFSSPEIGEEVLCIFLGDSLDRGFAIGSFFSEVNQPPNLASSLDKVVASYPGAGTIEWDMATGFFELKSLKEISIDSPKITLNAAESIDLSAPKIGITAAATATVAAPLTTIDAATSVDLKTPLVSNLTGVIKTSDVVVSVGSTVGHTHSAPGKPMNK